jgi:transcriptional regulator with XRE-family HTH domain
MAAPDPSPIAERRRARGLSQRALAKAAGISHVVLGYYERGLRPSTRALLKLADALQCSPSDLVPKEVRGE